MAVGSVVILVRDRWAAEKGPGLDLWFISLPALCCQVWVRLQDLWAVFGDKRGRRGFREINQGSM